MTSDQTPVPLVDASEIQRGLTGDRPFTQVPVRGEFSKAKLRRELTKAGLKFDLDVTATGGLNLVWWKHLSPIDEARIRSIAESCRQHSAPTRTNDFVIKRTER